MQCGGARAPQCDPATGESRAWSCQECLAQARAGASTGAYLLHVAAPGVEVAHLVRLVGPPHEQAGGGERCQGRRGGVRWGSGMPYPLPLTAARTQGSCVSRPPSAPAGASAQPAAFQPARAGRRSRAAAGPPRPRSCAAGTQWAQGRQRGRSSGAGTAVGSEGGQVQARTCTTSEKNSMRLTATWFSAWWSVAMVWARSARRPCTRRRRKRGAKMAASFSRVKRLFTACSSLSSSMKKRSM